MTGLTREQVRLSKRLSLVLRHRPEVAGLTLDAQGWVPVDELLAALTISRAALDAVVAGNDKARFAIARDAAGVERIRASQGHSRRVPVDLALPAVEPPEILLHGTARDNLESIMRDGLRPGSRHHVHLSPDVTTALAVGRRRAADVVILEVRAGELAARGHVFHRSANGVWLTSVVPAAFLRQRSG
jgi:putative RNA 2'-phosphotransferase